MNPRTLRIAGAALLAVVGIWAGLRMYAAHPGLLTAEVPRGAGIRVPAGEASPPIASDFDDPGAAALPRTKIPERLPAFSLADRTGKTTSIATWRDKSLIINFWATWCTPCRHEIPLLESLYREWNTRDVEVVGIAVDHLEKVLAYADELKIPYPLLVGEQDALDVAGAFGFESPVFPFTVFTDRQGEVVTLYVGELHRAEADLILTIVQELNQSRLPLSQARRAIADGLQALPPRNPG
jgi:peroxiredoxin